MKTCSKCGMPKDEAEFSRKSASKDGCQPWCKVCAAGADAIRQRNFSEADKETKRESTRKWVSENLEGVRGYSRKYRLEHPEETRENSRRYREENPEVVREYNKQYQEANREVSRMSENERYHSDAQFRLKKILRRRIGKALKLQKAGKNAPTMALLGCPWVWAEVHLESLFKPGMSWENHGPVWHIDHIKPCAAFDLTIPDQQRACFHWTNLQPLFALENIQKSDKYDSSPEPENHSVAQ